MGRRARCQAVPVRLTQGVIEYTALRRGRLILEFMYPGYISDIMELRLEIYNCSNGGEQVIPSEKHPMQVGLNHSLALLAFTLEDNHFFVCLGSSVLREILYL